MCTQLRNAFAIAQCIRNKRPILGRQRNLLIFGIIPIESAITFCSFTTAAAVFVAHMPDVAEPRLQGGPENTASKKRRTDGGRMM
jgi:hypothetical protein